MNNALTIKTETGMTVTLSPETDSRRRTRMTNKQIEDLADEAAAQGEHDVVAACQTLLGSTATEEDRRDARRAVREFQESIRGY